MSTWAYRRERRRRKLIESGVFISVQCRLCSDLFVSKSARGAAASLARHRSTVHATSRLTKDEIQEHIRADGLPTHIKRYAEGKSVNTADLLRRLADGVSLARKRKKAA